jgi:cardiolipin synthase
MKFYSRGVRLFLALCFFAGVSSSFGIEKLIRVPIQTDYGVEDPAFLPSIGGLLRAPVLEGNSVREYVNGTNIFPAMLEAISKAERTITFENFIWKSGELSDRFIDALTERARAGVKVHCIVDGFGALKLKHSDQERLGNSGVMLEIFNPMRPWNFTKWNHRTHRKLLTIDGKIGFIGGICISDAWDGDAPDDEHWRDTEFKVEGPVVSEFQGVFMDNWLRTRSAVPNGTNYFPLPEHKGNVLAQCFKSGPQDGAENARLLYLYSIAAARKTIRLSQSYFVPDNLAIDMLVEARKRGVKVEIITPGIIDANIVRRAARSRWDKLMLAGVDFYEYQPARYHCKVMIVDDIWVTCGSVNFDDRSFRINDEANINIYDREVAARQIAIFENDKTKCVKIERKAFRHREWYIRCVENFCGMFRGLL